MASQLWGLVDDPRGEPIGALRVRLGAEVRREERSTRFKAADLDETLALLSGLEEALVGTVIDQHWMFPMERLDEIRRRPPRLDLRPSRPAGDIVHAVGEGLWLTIALGNFLKEARGHGHEVISG